MSTFIREAPLHEFLTHPSRSGHYVLGRKDRTKAFPVYCSVCECIFEGSAAGSAVSRIESHEKGAHSRKLRLQSIESLRGADAAIPIGCTGATVRADSREFKLSKYFNDLEVYWRFHDGADCTITPQFESAEMVAVVVRAGKLCQGQSCIGNPPCNACKSRANWEPLLLKIRQTMTRHDIFEWYEKMSRNDSEGAARWYKQVVRGTVLSVQKSICVVVSVSSTYMRCNTSGCVMCCSMYSLWNASGTYHECVVGCSASGSAEATPRARSMLVEPRSATCHAGVVHRRVKPRTRSLSVELRSATCHAGVVHRRAKPRTRSLLVELRSAMCQVGVVHRRAKPRGRSFSVELRSAMCQLGVVHRRVKPRGRSFPVGLRSAMCQVGVVHHRVKPRGRSFLVGLRSAMRHVGDTPHIRSSFGGVPGEHRTPPRATTHTMFLMVVRSALCQVGVVRRRG